MDWTSIQNEEWKVSCRGKTKGVQHKPDNKVFKTYWMEKECYNPENTFLKFILWSLMEKTTLQINNHICFPDEIENNSLSDLL